MNSFIFAAVFFFSGFFPPTVFAKELCAGYEPVQKDYNNSIYGYSVTIPEGLIGCETKSPNPNHGIFIALGSQRKIFIDASFDADDPPSLRQAVMEWIDVEHPQQSSVVQAEFLENPALRARWVSAGQINDLIETMMPLADAPVLYSVHLQTDPAHEKQDKKIFDHVIGSFKRTVTDGVK